MPLSGVFFVSLHHQSNRMTMFKKTDPNPQLDIFTAPSMQLGSRASKKYSDPNSWHNQFYSLVTTKIDEEIFKPLFPGKMQGGYRWELIPHDEDGLTIREIATGNTYAIILGVVIIYSVR